MIYTYNIITKDFRKINTGQKIRLLGLDEVGDVVAFDAVDKKWYSIVEDESVGIEIETKTFRVSFERSVIIKEIIVRYRSSDSLSLEFYSDETLTSGTILKGEEYRIQDNSGSFDVTNLGAADNNVGTEFTSTGTTPTAWGTGGAAITAAASAGGGSKTTFTSNGHGLNEGYVVTLRGCDTASYDNTYVVETSATNTFVVDVPYVANETAGAWSCKGGTLVQISPLKRLTMPPLPDSMDWRCIIKQYCKQFKLRITSLADSVNDITIERITILR